MTISMHLQVTGATEPSQLVFSAHPYQVVATTVMCQ